MWLLVQVIRARTTSWNSRYLSLRPVKKSVCKQPSRSTFNLTQCNNNLVSKAITDLPSAAVDLLVRKPSFSACTNIKCRGYMKPNTAVGKTGYICKTAGTWNPRLARDCCAISELSWKLSSNRWSSGRNSNSGILKYYSTASFRDFFIEVNNKCSECEEAWGKTAEVAGGGGHS